MPVTIHLPLDQMTVAEELPLMEAIWASLSSKPDELESPAWHGEVLRERARQVEAGETHFIPWEEARREIDRRAANARIANPAATGFNRTP